MRLLRSEDLAFEEFEGEEKPSYAILSHRWGENEVLYKDMEDGSARQKKQGYQKIVGFARLAASEGYRYFWIDTCCIDKRNSSELTEAINSMYEWYRNAGKCYAYLVDVPNVPWQQSDWLTRGWTLQELIAPKRVTFYDHAWNRLGSKHQWSRELASVTSIPQEVLCRSLSPRKSSVAKRMSWASRRKTTRKEDMAYCLLGLFGVNMALLYGEGDKAFIRLQEEIIRTTDDQSILAWRSDEEFPPNIPRGLFAPSPNCFSGSGDVVALRHQGGRYPMTTRSGGIQLGIALETSPSTPGLWCGFLGCYSKSDVLDKCGSLGIYLVRLGDTSGRDMKSATPNFPAHFARVRTSELRLQVEPHVSKYTDIFANHEYHLNRRLNISVSYRYLNPQRIVMSEFGSISRKVGGFYEVKHAEGKLLGLAINDRGEQFTVIAGLSSEGVPFCRIFGHTEHSLEGFKSAASRTFEDFKEVNCFPRDRLGVHSAKINWIRNLSNMALELHVLRNDARPRKIS